MNKNVLVKKERFNLPMLISGSDLRLSLPGSLSAICPPCPDLPMFHPGTVASLLSALPTHAVAEGSFLEHTSYHALLCSPFP